MKGPLDKINAEKVSESHKRDVYLEMSMWHIFRVVKPYKRWNQIVYNKGKKWSYYNSVKVFFRKRFS